MTYNVNMDTIFSELKDFVQGIGKRLHSKNFVLYFSDKDPKYRECSDES